MFTNLNYVAIIAREQFGEKDSPMRRKKTRTPPTKAKKKLRRKARSFASSKLNEEGVPLSDVFAAQADPPNTQATAVAEQKARESDAHDRVNDFLAQRLKQLTQAPPSPTTSSKRREG